MVAAPAVDADRGPWSGADCGFKNVFSFIYYSFSVTYGISLRKRF